jgi:hypothetical protein
VKTLLRGLCSSVLMFALTSIAMGDIFITELADPNNESTARFVELFNNGTEAVNLSDGWSLGRYTNGNTTMTTTSRIPLRGVIPAGGFFIVCNNAGPFLEIYGMAADQSDVNAGPADSNGDDNILLLNPAWEVVDFYGRPGEDGSGTDHEFEDGRAQRVSTVTTGNPVFDPTEWEIDNDGGAGAGTVNAPDGFDPRVWFTHSATDFSLKNVQTLDISTINVTFSHPVDTVTAEMLANYDAGAYGAPTTAVLSGANTVELGFTAAMVHETVYTLTVNNVKNLDSSLTISANSTIDYSYYDYTGKIVLTEFVYNGEGSDNEWFEIYNASAETIDITGWMFRDEPTSHEPIIAGVTSDNVLAPGDYFTVYAYGEGEENGWPIQFTPDLNAAINYADTSRFHLWNLNNSNDIIYMWDKAGNLVDSIAYDQSIEGTVPVEAYRGMGQTVEVINPALSNDDPTNWQASYFYGGTPGIENITVAPVYPGVVISEVMYHSSLVDSAQVEWIEILNTETDTVDISGWFTLDDNPLHERIPFPEGTKIGPGEYLTIMNNVSSDTFTVPFTADFDFRASDVDFSDSQDNPLLFDADSNLVSYMYYDDGGAGEMFEHAAGADGLGYSLELIDPLLSNHDPLNWKASGGIGGTPGDEPLDEFPPTLVSAYALGDSIITVVFSESIDSTSAVVMANYSVNNAIGTPTAVVWSDYKVELSVAYLTHATDYEVTVSNVADVSGNIIAAGSVVSFTYQTYVDKIVINEFQYNSEYYDNEFIELFNASADTIDILGWSLRDEPESHALMVIPDSIDTVIPPGEYFTIYVYGEGEEKGWPLHFTPNLQAAIDYTDTTRNHIWNLNNGGGDMIYLWDDLGNLTDFVDYDVTTFPAPARWGTGCSVELIDPSMDRNDAESWQPSYFYGGTPGAANVTVAPDYPRVLVNEIMYNALGADTLEYEFVELYNADDVSVDISGWYIMDDNPTHGRAGVPAGTILEPGDYYVLLSYAGSPSALPDDFESDLDITDAAIGFSDSKDNCILFNADDIMMSFMHYDDGTAESTDDFVHAPEADGTGPSLALADNSGLNWTILSWIPSLEEGGTPGWENFDVTGPTIVSAVATSDTSVMLTFSEIVHPATGERLANYSFNNGIGEPLDAEADGATVLLVTTPLTVDLEYTITMSNIWDMLGNAIEANSTVSFVSTFVGIHDGVLPTVYALDQNFPNPFNPTTTIRYALPEVADVRLQIFDITGRQVNVLVNSTQQAGWYDLHWTGQDARGYNLAAGMYFARIQAGEYTEVIKMMYLK